MSCHVVCVYMGSDIVGMRVSAAMQVCYAMPLLAVNASHLTHTHTIAKQYSIHEYQVWIVSMMNLVVYVL